MPQRKWLLACAVFMMLCAGAYVALYVWREPIQPAVCARIHEGMTYEEVCRIVTRKCDKNIDAGDTFEGMNRKYWEGSNGILMVDFTDRLLVWRLVFVEHDMTWWRRFYRAIGLGPEPVAL